MRINESFDSPHLHERWTPTTIGGGALSCAASILRLSLPRSAAGRYADAQIDDYGRLRRSRFPWRPPLRLDVRARASLRQPALDAVQSSDDDSGDSIQGTAGFGFWNYPFSLTGSVLTLPDAVWFFCASPPSNMALVPGMLGWGWKAQVVHAHRLGALAAAIPTAAAVGWARMTGRTATAASWVRRLSGSVEATLTPTLADWHDYSIEWYQRLVRFWVDGVPMLEAPSPPGPLGFVAWIDNQYAVATPRGEFRFGTMATTAQWLEIDSIHIANG